MRPVLYHIGDTNSLNFFIFALYVFLSSLRFGMFVVLIGC